MDRKELVRWCIPALGFVGYVSWGGVLLALLFALILLAVISGLIHWHARDAKGFFRGMRVWSVILVLLPAIGLTLAAFATSPVLVVPALALLTGAIWLVRWASRHAASAPVVGAPSMAARNLETANELTRTMMERGRRTRTRGALLHAQSENVDLVRQKTELAAQNAALQQKIDVLEREASLPPDPFAEPVEPRRSQA